MEPPHRVAFSFRILSQCRVCPQGIFWKGTGIATRTRQSEVNRDNTTNRASSVSVVITTCDRRDLCLKAIDSVLAQTVPVELVIIDDGSRDDTSDQVRARHPDAVVQRNEWPVGIIAARNQAFHIARGDVVFTLDDDAVFSSAEVVENVLRDFELPFVGAVTIPLTDHFPDGTTRIRIDEEAAQADFRCIRIFSGGANAIRRGLFLQLGGYAGMGRQFEERGVAIRMLEKGYIVKVADQARIDHFPQVASADRERIIYWNTRNGIAWACRYAPFPQVIWHCLGMLFQHLKIGIAERKPLQPATGFVAGIGDCLGSRELRTPVRVNTFKVFCKLGAQGIIRFDELQRLLARHSLELAREHRVGAPVAGGVSSHREGP